MSGLKWIIHPRRTAFIAFALFLGLTALWFVRTANTDEPPRRLGDRFSDFSPTDILLARKARDVLQKDEQLASVQLIVTVKNRIVTLKGTAAGADQVKRAMGLLRDIQGVASVDNECIIGATDSAPEEVAAAMRRAQRQGRPEEPTPTPSALTGRVGVLERIPAKPAEDPHESTSGKSMLPPPPTTVLFHPELPLGPAELAEALEKIRAGSPRFKDLRLTITEGVARVSGKVDRMSDANDFADQIGKLYGIKQVLLSKVEER